MDEVTKLNILNKSFEKSFSTLQILRILLGTARVDVRGGVVRQPTKWQRAYSLVLIVIVTASIYGMLNDISMRFSTTYIVVGLASSSAFLEIIVCCYIMTYFGTRLTFINSVLKKGRARKMRTQAIPLWCKLHSVYWICDAHVTKLSHEMSKYNVSLDDVLGALKKLLNAFDTFVRLFQFQMAKIPQHNFFYFDHGAIYEVALRMLRELDKRQIKFSVYDIFVLHAGLPLQILSIASNYIIVQLQFIFL
ncbi:hypothetical protein EVAR_2400_1 [Eumeta japonica]|uniref:Gustatory receptor n=1 Tax=Eumeta variegata TaxID=151549 RepID=A0A4C1SNT4_EUMVA|nr:hypothetical protein EVAR_2400_1 [Eumeta japonica]